MRRFLLQKPPLNECDGFAGEPDKLVKLAEKLRSEEAVGVGVKKSVELHVQQSFDPPPLSFESTGLELCDAVVHLPNVYSPDLK